MPFTEAEEAFIQATMPVLEISEEMLAVAERYQAAAENAENLTEAVGDEQAGAPAADTAALVHRLVLEAGSRVGFGPEHRVIQGINQGYQELLQMQELMDSLAEEAARREARNLLGITDDQVAL